MNNWRWLLTEVLLTWAIRLAPDDDAGLELCGVLCVTKEIAKRNRTKKLDT